MAAQVQLVFGTMVAKLDNLYFTKAREGFHGALRWLDDHLAQVLRVLPASRDLSLFEVSLFCLMEHIPFRNTLSVEPYAKLTRFSAEFAERPSAQCSGYRQDVPPVAQGPA
jgi:hypothetical protein